MPAEFSVFTKRACPKERNDFFVTLSNYIEMLHPDADKSTVISAANIAVLEAQKDAVQALNDLRSGKKNGQSNPARGNSCAIKKQRADGACISRAI